MAEGRSETIVVGGQVCHVAVSRAGVGRALIPTGEEAGGENCPDCQGEGVVQLANGHWAYCLLCDGTGLKAASE